MIFNYIKVTALMVGVVAWGASASADVVVNGSFETGDFTGWTPTGDSSYNYVLPGNYLVGVDPYQGNYQAYFGAYGDSGGIEQTLNTTPGLSYVITYAMANLGGTPSEFQLGWDGKNIVDTVNPAPFSYTLFTQDVVAAGNDTLSFNFEQDPGYFLLDAVNITYAPEPSQIISGLALTGLGGVVLLARRLRRKR